VRTQFLELPQARQTFTVLGGRTPGCWGLHYGVNENHVAAGCATWRSLLHQPGCCLAGTDLVRLVLERCRCARQGVDLLTDLVERYGQAACATGEESNGDQLFLVADAREAFVVEAAGTGWALQTVQAVRAVSDVGLLRQDWERLAHGLAGQAIARGRWPDDGSKLDFAEALNAQPGGQESALRRWGRATFLLEEQNGHIDAAFLRRLLADHYDGTRFEVDPHDDAAPVVPLCRHGGPDGRAGTAGSFLVALLPGNRPVNVAWCAVGPPCVGVYFPVALDAHLPDALTSDAAARRMQQLLCHARAGQERWARARDTLGQLQTRFDHDAAEFAAEAAVLKESGSRFELERLAASLMESHQERFEEVAQSLLAARPLKSDSSYRPHFPDAASRSRVRQ
jgi:dipeptidase